MVPFSKSSNPVTIVSGLLRELRPRQWYKQGVMLLGIIFSKNLANIDAWFNLFIGIIAFTAIAGAAYILNDITDREEDRNHPEKQHRPIARGRVSVTEATGFGIFLIAVGLVAAHSIGPLLLAVLLTYLAQNILYSLYLKQVIFVDVIIIAIGFVLRAIAGVVAIGVFLSPWLVVSTFLLALVLALGKRRTELDLVDGQSDTRKVLEGYTKHSLDQLLVMIMATLLMAYSLYTFSRSDPTMMLTLPFTFFGVFRYHHLVHTTDIAGQPYYLFFDRPLSLNLVLWAICTVAVLYNAPETAVEVIR